MRDAEIKFICKDHELLGQLAKLKRTMGAASYAEVITRAVSLLTHVNDAREAGLTQLACQNAQENRQMTLTWHPEDLKKLHNA